MKLPQNKPILPLPVTPKLQPDQAKAVESWEGEGEGGKAASAEDRYRETIAALLKRVAARPVIHLPNGTPK